MWAARQLTGVEWAEARAGLDAEQHELEAELASLPIPEEKRDPTAILADRPVMTLDARRQVTARVDQVGLIQMRIAARQLQVS
jgi:site-specific DNA recombinase